MSSWRIRTLIVLPVLYLTSYVAFRVFYIGIEETILVNLDKSPLITLDLDKYDGHKVFFYGYFPLILLENLTIRTVVHVIKKDAFYSLE